MRASGHIGRVGGLALALGIGAAAGSLGVAGGLVSGVASAAPGDGASSSADSSSAAAPSSRGSRASVRTPTTRAAAEKPRRASQDSKPAPAAATRPAKPVPAVRGPAAPAEAELAAPTQTPAAASPAFLTAPAAVVEVPVAPVKRVPAALRAATAPRVAATAAVGSMQSVPVPFSNSGSDSPAESAMSWTVLAAVRRLGRPDPDPAPAATVSTGQILKPRAAAKSSIFSRLFNKTPTASPTQNGQSGTGVIAGNLNAADRDGDSLTFTVATNPAYGTVQIDPSGGFTYTPDGAAAHNGVTDQFAITVSDEAAGSHRHGFFGKNRHAVTATITVTVTPVNAAPTATATTAGPDATTGVVTGEVNGRDTDGDPLTYTGSAGTDKGAVVVDADGGFTYTPTAPARHAAANLSATAADKIDGFTLTVSDDRGASTAVAVSVRISPANAAPTATTSAGIPDGQTGAVIGQVAGADADTDPLSYAGSATTSKGVVVVDESGGFTYTPAANARHNAAAVNATAADKIDLFTVTVSDGHGGTVLVPVTVAVSPRNTAPTATAAVGVPNPATGVVLGAVTASDPDGDVLTYAGATTSKGTAAVGSGGQITYTPTGAARHAAAAPTATAADMSDTVTITVTDGHGGSVAVPVTVTIAPGNTAPTGTAISETPDPTTGLIAGAVIGADADGDALAYAGSTTTAKGSAVVAGTGGFSYTPTAEARHRAAALTATAADKTDTFTVTISDGYGGSTAVPVTVAIAPLNTAPVASAGVGAPNPSTGVVTGSVAATDADRDPLSYSGSVTAKGTAVVSANGAITYTPTAAARHAAAKLTATQADKSDTFTVTVSDGHGGSTTVPVTVAISAANSAPTGTSTAGMPDATTGVVAGAVLGTDLDRDALSYSGSGATAKGDVVVGADGGFTYTPTALARHVAGLAGATATDTTDTFLVAVADGYGGTVNVPVTVAVSPAAITFNFVYGTGSQYWTPEARAALNAAATRLASSIVVSRPVTLTYDVVGDNNSGSGWIGTSFAKFTSNSPGYYGTVVQTNIITGTDANGSATDSQIGMNFAYPWALGDTVPSSQYDFQSVATHELFHTLGMMTGLGSNPGSIDRNWTTYDSYLATVDGTAVIGPNYVWNATYTPNLTGGNGGLFFNGPNAVAAYGGLIPLYTPGTWTSGSSLTHLDPADAPPGTTYLMDPADGRGIGVRTPTPVELAILEDLGYTVYQPGGYAVFFIGFFLRRRQRS